jgi:low affinity Fe/Cu permease
MSLPAVVTLSESIYESLSVLLVIVAMVLLINNVHFRSTRGMQESNDSLTVIEFDFFPFAAKRRRSKSRTILLNQD